MFYWSELQLFPHMVDSILITTLDEEAYIRAKVVERVDVNSYT